MGPTPSPPPSHFPAGPLIVTLYKKIAILCGREIQKWKLKCIIWAWLEVGLIVLDSRLVIDSCLLFGSWNGKKTCDIHINIFDMYTCTSMYCSS